MTGESEYSRWFERATGNQPFPYQRKIAESDSWPAIVSVPTGLGKTAAIILAWLWRRKCAGDSVRQQTPRRLVYCLPMRVLVEQTQNCAVEWLKQLGLLGGGFDANDIYEPWKGTENPDLVCVHTLMGGDVDRDWDMYPEKDAILIGTQDMLISRALNRGYSLSRFRWPVQFGLLNNDCLWVMDEVQLMGDGLATTAQLQAFRRNLGTVKNTRSTWMSATMRADWLATVDFEPHLDAPSSPLEISDEDKKHKLLKPRFAAIKRLAKAEFNISADGAAEADLAKQLHMPGSRTLIVVNTVKRAQAIYSALRKRKSTADLVLIHSRFRPAERKTQLSRLLSEPGENGMIGVCTQVVEAGVDVSARVLITDLAPWASLVQRFGRCNRKGEFNDSHDANVVWIEHADLASDEKLKGEPYTAEELRDAAQLLAKQDDVGPSSLPTLEQRMFFRHVIRRKDILDLFDTTPDLAGADIDISRFIRETNDRAVQVFWRAVAEKDEPSPTEPQPDRNELCSVPIGELDQKKRGLWRWDHISKQWAKPDFICPGMVLMLRACEGGYGLELGWTGNEPHTTPIEAKVGHEESNDDDPLTEDRHWLTIAEHTNQVVADVESSIDAMGSDIAPWRNDLLSAARWHDAGKSHPVFQNAMPQGAPRMDTWAKSRLKMNRYERPGFRHELASALVMLVHGQSDLAAYLAAAHHGKVRLSIRSLPHEKRPTDDPQRRFARGLWDGDLLPAANLGGGVMLPESLLDLSYVELGEGVRGRSWLSRMLVLRDSPELGPFRLAFLESLMRTGDWRASGAAIGCVTEGAGS